MIPTAFDYARAESADDAVRLLVEHGDDAKLIAGGHSLLPLMKLRFASPAMLIDIGRLTDLSYVRTEGDEVAIGALTRYCDLVTSETIATEAPLIGRAASLVGDQQVRHRGTIGGTLAHGDPASDLPGAVLATGGSLVAQGPSGRRTIEMADFFRGFFETALQPDELLVEIRLPRLAGRGYAYEKFVRRANDWAIVGVATVDGRVALVNMGQTPLRANKVEEALRSGASAADAAALAAEDTSPPADMHAGEEFRRHLARVLTKRGLRKAGRD
ncbi:FAD binding domain-containing protein [Fodinicola acaciae]|uniref:FAD binding domain-containing protein n=1 Tax=Fodinicola acaciae TaxID=2681555 RepID=UPI0013D5E5A3|nr:xanthine dehydrogenase family protein subunit M [Fodinicola acaciae]